MADQAPNTPAAPAATVDPAEWLSRFESAGGGFLVTDNQIRLCIVCKNGTPACQCIAHTLIHNRTDDQRGQVVMRIRMRTNIVGVQPDLNAITSETFSDQPPIGQPSSGGALDGHSEGTHKMDMTHAFDGGSKDNRTIPGATCTDKPLTGGQLYDAWRYAKAQWELVEYGPNQPRLGVLRETTLPLFDAIGKALNAYLLHPSADLPAFARKLRVFRDEEIWDGWHMAEEITAVIANDAHRLAFEN